MELNYILFGFILQVRELVVSNADVSRVVVVDVGVSISSKCSLRDFNVVVKEESHIDVPVLGGISNYRVTADSKE